MSFFDNTVTHSSLKGTFLAWGIIVILLFVFLITYAILSTQQQNGVTKQFMNVTSVLTIIYLFVSGVWWFGLHNRCTVVV